MAELRPRIARLTSLTGVCVAVFVASMPPLGYLAMTYQHASTNLAATAKVQAERINRIIVTNPDSWQYQDRMIATLISEQLELGVAQAGDVRDKHHRPLWAVGPALREPVIRRSETLFDAGDPVGSVRVAQSMHDALGFAALLALPGMLLGALVYLMLRVLPLRELSRAHRDLKSAHDSLFVEKERAQVTLESIGDAVVTTGVDMRVQYLNPIASNLIGLTTDQAFGRPMHEIFRIVNESSRLPVPNPIEQCLNENRIVEMANHTLLLRPDGIEFAIEDSAAPIRDLAGTVIGAVMVFHDVTERKNAQRRLDYLAYHDSLTGLPNRLSLRERLKHAMAHAKRHDLNVGVLLLDLDRFKVVNDTFGHGAGDVLLMEVAARLRACVRENDTVARLGGDEFTIMLEELATMEATARVARKIIDRLSEPFLVGGHELTVTASIGISSYPGDAQDIEGLLKNADAAMYHAKEQGGSGFEFHNANMNEAGLQRLKMQHALAQALRLGEFQLHYQPKLRAGDGAVIGVEALLRWNAPEFGPVPPGDFVPLLEESGHIIHVGEWVLREAATQARAWLDAGHDPLRMAVNLSARQFRQKDLAATLFRILDETDLPPSALELEITESMLIDADLAHRQIAALKAGGVKISIDDFGTGYSSLSYLRQYDIDLLKIDRSFVRDIGVAPHHDALVESIVAMAHSLRIAAVAEGVETPAQASFLRRIGCDELQGFLIGRPMPALDFVAWRTLGGFPPLRRRRSPRRSARAIPRELAAAPRLRRP